MRRRVDGFACFLSGCVKEMQSGVYALPRFQSAPHDRRSPRNGASLRRRGSVRRSSREKQARNLARPYLPKRRRRADRRAPERDLARESGVRAAHLRRQKTRSEEAVDGAFWKGRRVAAVLKLR